MAKYGEGTEIEGIVKRHGIISKWHPELRGFTVFYAFVDDMTSKGQTVLATIKKASAWERFALDCDIILKVNQFTWNGLSEAQRVALLDHEFCHLDTNEAGDLVTLGHDLEEFNAIVRRHGFWKQDVRVFAQQCELFGKRDEQLAEAEKASQAAADKAFGNLEVA